MYGVPREIRTLDPMIKSHVLCQLSYGHVYKQKLLKVNNCILCASARARGNDIAAIYHTDIITSIFAMLYYTILKSYFNKFKIKTLEIFFHS